MPVFCILCDNFDEITSSMQLKVEIFANLLSQIFEVLMTVNWLDKSSWWRCEPCTIDTFNLGFFQRVTFRKSFRNFDFLNFGKLYGIFFWNVTFSIFFPQSYFLEFPQCILFQKVLVGVHVATLRPGNPTIPEFETMSGKHLGSGLVLCEPPTKKTKHVPLNSGKSYLKWQPFTTILLLCECRDKEVWAVDYGKKCKCGMTSPLSLNPWQLW